MSIFNNFKSRIEKTIEIYSDLEYIELDEFYENNFGKTNRVLRDNYPSGLYVDIYIVKPNKVNNYYTVVTCGIGAHKMYAKDENNNTLDDRSHMELVMYLPKSWNFRNLDDYNNIWPLNLMKHIAGIPRENYNYIVCGDTVSNNGVPYSKKSKLNSSLLLNTLDNKSKPLQCKLSSGKVINFYTVMPIYEEELNYIFKFNVNKLIKLFDKNNFSYPPVLKLNRKNVCSK